MDIYICIGSSCHLRGSYEIINLMKEYLDKYNLSNKVNLSAAFCLGKCTDGVSVKVNNDIICGVSIDNFMLFFTEHILDKFKGDTNE